ncbi:hypothetical protein [Herbaspirillum seropedicae]|uniref:hypothetical protein n=1 Tax=Herbaspirillum seropedicae TaxID=964 RepID=UPI001E57E56B|nr:hypothetical protein [Herbaspirillum seropedicae]
MKQAVEQKAHAVWFLPSRAHDEAEYRVLPEARASLICSLLTPVGQILKRSIRKFQAASPAQVHEQNNAGWWRNGPLTSFSVGIGEGSYWNLGGNGGGPQQKVCVGNSVGTVNVTVGKSWDDRTQYEVGVYDRVAFLDPFLNGFAIKVYMNNNLYRTIRPQF